MGGAVLEQPTRAECAADATQRPPIKAHMFFKTLPKSAELAAKVKPNLPALPAQCDKYGVRKTYVHLTLERNDHSMGRVSKTVRISKSNQSDDTQLLMVPGNRGQSYLCLGNPDSRDGVRKWGLVDHEKWVAVNSRDDTVKTYSRRATYKYAC
jgi:hypothetical protein